MARFAPNRVPKALARAAAGIYTEWSFRDTPDWVKPRCFTTRSGSHCETQPWPKRMVEFACLNLAEDVYPSILNNTNAMDLILCGVWRYVSPRVARSDACAAPVGSLT